VKANKLDQYVLTNSNNRRQRHGSGDRNDDYDEQQCHRVKREDTSHLDDYDIVRADFP